MLPDLLNQRAMVTTGSHHPPRKGHKWERLQKPREAARSPVTDKVFAAVLTELRADPDFEAALCDRLEDALAPGETINAANLKEVLFPPNKAETK